ncbi:hypothetical protein FRC01_014201, partial [Tulasnella sp. 417]
EAISLTTSMPADSTRSETPPSTVHTRYPLPSAISTLDTVDEYDSFASDSQSEADDFRTATQGRDRDSRNRRSGRRESERLWPRNRSRSPPPPPPSASVASPFSPFTPLPPRQHQHHHQRSSNSHQPPLNRGGHDDEGLSEADSFTTIHPIRPQLVPFSPLDTSQSSLATQSEFDAFETASEGGRTRTGVSAMSRSVVMGAGRGRGRGRAAESPLKSASELSVDTLRPQDARSPGSRSPSVTPRGSPRRLPRGESDFIDAPPPIEVTPGTPGDYEDEDADGRSKTPVPGASAEVRSPKPRSVNASEKGSKAKGKARQDEPPLSPTTEMRSPKPRSTASRGKKEESAARAAAAAAALSPATAQGDRLFPRANSPSKFDIERSANPVPSPKPSKSRSAASRSRAAASEKGGEEAQPLTPQGSRSPVVVRRTSPLLSTQALSIPPGEARSEERVPTPTPRTPKITGTPPRSPVPMRSTTPPRSPFEAGHKFPASP